MRAMKSPMGAQTGGMQIWFHIETKTCAMRSNAATLHALSYKSIDATAPSPMRLTSARKLFLALALLLGQWLLAAHTFEHPALSADHQDCHLCSHVQSLGTAPPPAGAVTLVPNSHEAPDAVPPALVSVASRVTCLIRGPPRAIAV
ncbi:hypothetical protein WQQ_19110 [Hydrocarboniphaga effusa AP103]|uniref:DUF2946 domain-containing protein n=2 Tax=Nevskiaceae TaxID=568386 RepID=I7ZIM1_9GAMM|nr:hypothetical protein WQQ_19110 [Hydrocarboniphaga effusa AP103]